MAYGARVAAVPVVGIFAAPEVGVDAFGACLVPPGDRPRQPSGSTPIRPAIGVHLAAVVACFAIAPYTKFMHVVYRFLALVHDSAEAL